MRQLMMVACLSLGAHSCLCAQEVLVESVVLTIAQQAEVPAQENGLLADLRVREGQKVKAGELLAKLDDADARLGYQRASLDLERAQKLAENDVKVRLTKKELEIAQSELQRAEDAAKRLQDSVTGAEFDRLRLDVQRASLAVEQTEFELDNVRLAVRVQENEVQLAIEKGRRRRIVAPISGTVVIVNKQVGEWLEAGQSVARIIATDRLRAEGFLATEQLARTWIDHRVQLLVRIPGMAAQRFPGTIAFVNPQIDPVTGQARMWAEIDNQDGKLQPGLAGSLLSEP